MTANKNANILIQTRRCQKQNKKSVVILVDMNIITDHKLYVKYGKKILEMCIKRKVTGIITVQYPKFMLYT